MSSLAELGLKELINDHAGDFRASLYTSDGNFIAWYRHCVRVGNGMKVRDTSSHIVEGPQLSQEQLLGAQAWLKQHHT